MELTSGDVIDHRVIRTKINQLAKDFNIQFINYDRVFTTTLVTELTDDGISLHPMGQGSLSMSGPITEFETMVLNKKLNHGQNEIMRWQIGNVVIITDNSGGKKVDKSKPQNKIDGVVCNIMALAAYQQHLAETPKEKEYVFIKVM